MSGRLKVVAIATHPIQYYTPWFRLLAAEPSLQFKVIYLRKLDAQRQGEGFGIAFEWDVDLLAGYDSIVPSQGLWRALRDSGPDAVLLTGWQEPALVSDRVGAKDVVTMSGAGWVVPAGDAAALADRMCWVADHPQALVEAKQRARAAARDWTWERYRARVADTVLGLLAKDAT